jgi:putative addiction module CopG family antidote
MEWIDIPGGEGESQFMNVMLPPLLEDFLRRKVADGKFQSVEEGVCEGVRLLQRSDHWQAEVREKIDVGWAQAKAGPLRTREEVSQNLAARKRAWKSGQRG